MIKKILSVVLMATALTVTAQAQQKVHLAKGDKTKTVYLPYEATNLMGSIGGIKDLFKEP